MMSQSAPRARTTAAAAATAPGAEPSSSSEWKSGGDVDVEKGRSRHLFFYIVTGLLSVLIFYNTALAMQWWWQARLAHKNPWPEDVTSGADNDAPDDLGALYDAPINEVHTKSDDGHELTAAETADASAAVDAILASRGNEPHIRRPLADVVMPSADHCATLLPVRPEAGPVSVRAALEKFFEAASGFWAAGAEEVAAVSKAAGAGLPGPCAEATYGEIEVDGLDSVMKNLRGGAEVFKVLVDLGAGVGRTAAAALLLGHATRAFGVELGPQRFAMGCQAFSQVSRLEAHHAGATNVRQAQLELLRGDARTWVEQAAARSWPRCGLGWVFYLGAECFRDSLLGDIADAIVRGCDPGARLAVLGRRLPDPTELAKPGSFKDLGLVRARTTWSASSEVFLYELVGSE